MQKRKTDLVVTGCIFRVDGVAPKVLFILHKKLNLWLPVGGHIDPNETPDEAMIREAKEEVNLDIILIGHSKIQSTGNVSQNLALPYYVNVHSVGDHDHCSFFYAAYTKNPGELKTKPEEINDAKWLTLQEMSEAGYIKEETKNTAKGAFEFFSKHFQ